MVRIFIITSVIFCGACSLINPILDYQINRASEKFSTLVPDNSNAASTQELIYGVIALAGMYLTRKGYLKIKGK